MSSSVRALVLGLSTFPDGHRPDWRLARYVNDTLTLAEYLQARYQRRVFLVGHSWGTLLAVEAIERRPDLFTGYLDIAQQVDVTESDRRTHAALMRRADALPDRDLQADLLRVQGRMEAALAST